ncbi:ABC transporter substrate-binding protein [Kribbella sandramycini]|uniref:ABC transporter substrate-binding protein n=1 Tax=Kribbella sandramycini TaxID=60450 RepID=A0A7Y4NZM3_9ACTN|nr:ABC transporter substrate-binding protein [Kribbella sandramycini]MBB6567257.1 peptide/nickel transport system substrate-binding protein [Kribbella sandramycini]NOL40129.1 ABC transporter substrate-binding protein [Kribbella sandramycini]
MRRIGATSAVCVLALLTAACGGASPAAEDQALVDGATFSFNIDSDPGNLDPQAGANSWVQLLGRFGYDPLVHVDAQGKILPGLATAWEIDGNQLKLTLKNGVTCSDGTQFTAATAVENLAWVADPKNKSPLLGVYLPAGTKATADDAAGTVTLQAPQLGSFVLHGLARLAMVCGKGLHDRKTLAHGMAGTGPYLLTTVAANDRYTFTKRDGYTWGPGGLGTDLEGLPQKVVARIVPNATTAANLLLSGELNAATVVGPDAKRLQAANLFAAKMPLLVGEMWFNQAPGRPAADQAVRQALTHAVDLPQLAKVLTSGAGTPPTTLASVVPLACPGNSVTAALPAHDLAQAKQLLDQAGWVAGADGVRTKAGKPLALTLSFNTALGTGISAAAELATKTWTELGVKVTSKPQDNAAINGTLFGTGDWDIAWVGVNTSSPDQLVPFVSGPVPPAGTNFAHVDNAAYRTAVAAAAKLPGAGSCDQWLAAETKLIADVDVIPFANDVLQTFGKGARFENIGGLVPTSIRMLAG